MLSDHIPLEMESRVDIFTLHLYDGDEGELVSSDVCLHKLPGHRIGLVLIHYIPKVGTEPVHLSLPRLARVLVPSLRNSEDVQEAPLALAVILPFIGTVSHGLAGYKGTEPADRLLIGLVLSIHSVGRGLPEPTLSAASCLSSVLA